MSKTILYHQRAFLNEGRGSAIIEVTFEDHGGVNKDGERWLSFSGTLHITDCSRSIELDASFSDMEGARNSIRKLDRLIDAIQGMREAAVRAVKREFPGRKL